MSATVPNRKRPSGAAFDGWADAPITTRSWLADSRMMAVRTDVASRRMPRTRRVPPCSRTKRSSASCSRCSARSPVPFGTMCSTATCAPKRLPRSRARRMASSACGPPRTGTRIERTSSTPRCLTTAMSHGDSRTTASMVGEKTAGPSRRGPRAASARAAAAGDGGPPQPKMTRSVPSSPTASITPSAARRLMRTMVRISTRSSSPKSSTRCSRRRAVRAWVAPCDRETPSGTSTMPSAVISVARPLLTPEPMRTRSRAVRGLASGSRMRYGARRRGGIRVPGRPRRASPSSASPGRA